MEFISLSRDTTESDLKQRREVINKTAVRLHLSLPTLQIYVNQGAVTAAIEGRILIIEGVKEFHFGC